MSRAAPRAAPLSITVAGTLDAVPRARRSLSQWLRKAGASDRISRELGLVVTELCNNAVEHGAASEARPVLIFARVARGVVEMDIRESATEQQQGLAGAMRAATAPPDVADERGRGLFLVRAYVDDVAIEHDARGELRIHLRKKLAR
ncbi:MAG TPA: ATP-binding protein [Planctomycetota bacterium]|nr:ATP-binding protein [Planctomycetota bacterium]